MRVYTCVYKHRTCARRYLCKCTLCIRVVGMRVCVRVYVYVSACLFAKVSRLLCVYSCERVCKWVNCVHLQYAGAFRCL